MKKLLSIVVLVMVVAVSSIASATTVVFTWDKSTDTSVVNQKIYYAPGVISGTPAVISCPVPPYIGTGATQGVSGYSVPNGTGTTVGGLDSTKSWCFAFTNINSVGGESPYCASIIIPNFPTTPANVKFIAVSQ